MSESGSVEPYPEPSKGDLAEDMARRALSLVPSLGAPAAALIDVVFAPALEKRRIQWFNELAELANDLQARDPSLTVASLSADDEWIDAALAATRIALCTHREEKWRALKSALAHVALRDEPDRDLDSTFLNLIDVLTPSHLRVLHMLQSTPAFAAGRGTTVPLTIDRSFRRVVERLLPDVPLGVYTLLRTDLESRGLVMTGSAAVAASRDPVDQRLTTPLGDKFLGFIGDSVSDEDEGATPDRPYPDSASDAQQAPSGRSSLRDLARQSLEERHRAVRAAGTVVDADETEVWDETAGDGIEE